MTTDDTASPTGQAYATQPLGLLKKMEDVRSVWPDEAQHFTPWLSEQLGLLGDTIGLELEFEAREKWVGPFRADILCKDTASHSWVLIENQFGKTDHSHLGQLLTYAAGLEAVTIIWIAERFTDEHRAALDWLNRTTAEGINFFGLELELWQIGTSAPAPKFNIVSQPNDWAKTVAAVTTSGTLGETDQLKLEYWTAFRDFAALERPSWKPPKAQAQHWMDFSIGRSRFWIGGRINTQKKVLTFGLYNDLEKAFFRELHAQKDEIEQAFGSPMEWNENPSKRQSQVEYRLENADVRDRNDWGRQHAWFLKQYDQFKTIFAPRVANLTGEQLNEPPEDAP